MPRKLTNNHLLGIKALTQAKQQYPELKRVQSQVLQEVMGRLDKAFNFFWKRSFGFPRFKKYGRCREDVTLTSSLEKSRS
nr:hypothetical protein [Spirulina subsalsa]